MDNAQKAIMIGVGLFITIIIISAVLLITNLGTDLVDNARQKLANISTGLQNQVLQAYDGKTLTGSEVISAVEQYQNSEMSVIVATSLDTLFKTGKYGFTTASFNTTKPIAGGIKTADSTYKELTTSSKDSLAKMQDVSNNGITSSQSYYSYVVKDASTDTVMGLVFVKVGAGLGTSKSLSSTTKAATT